MYGNWTTNMENQWTSPFLMAKSTINDLASGNLVQFAIEHDPFNIIYHWFSDEVSIAMLVYQMVTKENDVLYRLTLINDDGLVS